MMKYSHLLLHFGELSTKGINKKAFITRFMQSLRRLGKKEFPECTITSDYAHAYIKLEENSDFSHILSFVQELPGIQRITPVVATTLSLDDMKKDSLTMVKDLSFHSFKVRVRRPNHRYPIEGLEVARQIGGYLLANLKGIHVDVHHPDLYLDVEIRENVTYLSSLSYEGAGGYPLGSGGKALMLLSGGIDSPVASYLLLKRGLKLEYIHFAAPPYTSSAVIDKLADLLTSLSSYQEKILLHVVPFTNLQLSIYEHVDEPYCITIMRRMMLRIASSFARTHRLSALATGESVGQVASQTVESMEAINAVTTLPILRPLVAVDKVEIMKMAKKIGTYEISIRPYEDCCTIFKPKKPKTKPKEKECLYYESKWDYEKEIEEILQKMKTYELSEDGCLLLKEKKEKN